MTKQRLRVEKQLIVRFSLTSSYTTINVYEYLINMLSEVMLLSRNYALCRSINLVTCPALARTEIQPEKWTCTRIVYGHERALLPATVKKHKIYYYL